jgi:ferredoxin-nitrite reductase
VFSTEQKEYLEGLLAGIAQRRLYPYVGLLPDTGILTANPGQGGANLAAPAADHAPAEETIFGTPLSEVTRQELWKHAENPLDSWDRVLAHAQAGKFPDAEDTFRLRYFGLFYVAPAQDSFMMRCRIPAGQLTAVQWSGLADIADDFGDGHAAITTRSNLQIRGIAPNHLVDVLLRLHGLGLTAKGSGVDNVRNITASPTAGIDPQELLDTGPFAHALHHYILNHRDLYGLPRKFNVAFEGGGSIDTVADTNDIGFMAVTLPASVPAGVPGTPDLTPGVYFRVELAGISGHRQLATDAGILVRPAEAVAVAAAMIRVFSENGDRTDRKKARLKYLIDRWGIPKFLEETRKKLAFPLPEVPIDRCQRRPAPLKHGHVGVYRQKQPGKNYLGVVVPVGVLRSKQMRRLAELATHYGNGQIRLTPWQNLLLTGISDGFVETVKRQVVRAGLHHEATHLSGGLVACTGSTGCKWAATDTKGHALALIDSLRRKVQPDKPVNIHFTGCPNSCAQHYIGDIGLQGVKVATAGGSGEGYHVVLGGGSGAESGIGRQVFTGIPASEIPPLVERILRTYADRRNPGESFVEFTRRHDLKSLQELFS